MEPHGSDRREEQAERLKQLTARHARLVQTRLANEAELRQLQKEEARLKAAAEQRYGTSDPAELRRMHEEAVVANDARLEAFEGELAAVEGELGRIEEGARVD